MLYPFQLTYHMRHRPGSSLHSNGLKLSCRGHQKTKNIPSCGPSLDPCWFLGSKTGLSCARSTKVLTAHNPKVGGSNPPPATKPFNHLRNLQTRTWHHL